MNMQKPTRQCNLDFLRIASMFLIVLLHTIIHSGVLESATVQGYTVNSFYIYFLYALTQICVNCYILLSGYFLVTSHFKLSKLLTLWIETVVYSLLFKSVFMLLGTIPFSITSLVSCFLPITTGRYWFVTIYFGMYLLSPFLNIAIRAMDRRKHSLLNLVLFVLTSALISLHPDFKGMNCGGGWSLAWFVVLYFVGSWLRLYYRPNHKVLPKLLSWLSIPILMTIALFLARKLDVGIVVSVTRNWIRYDSAPVYLASLLFFTMFLNVRIPQGGIWVKLVSFVSPLTFGVYLIHDHPDVRLWLWEYSKLSHYTQEIHFPLIQLGITVTVFFLCLLIEAARKLLLQRVEHSQRLNKLCNYTTDHFLAMIFRITSKL